MSAFKGSARYSVDSKGRISIPASLRKDLSPEANESFVVIRGFEGSLRAYPLDEWKRIEEQIRKLSSNNPQHRLYKRMLLELAYESKLDAQFRIMIPRDLLQVAGIDNEVHIIGQMEYIEIWNPKNYAEYVKTQDTPFEAVAQTILPE